MKDFLKIVMSDWERFIQVRINHSDRLRIQDKVVSSLGLKNINELRDRYDGVSFLEKFFKDFVSIIALETYLNHELIDNELVNPKEFDPVIFVEGSKIRVISTEYGKFPGVDINPKEPAIITILRDDQNVWICGLASKKILKQKQDNQLLKNTVTLKDKRAFTGFSDLIQFKSYDELVTALVKQKVIKSLL